MFLKSVLLSLSIIGALVVSQAASADSRNNRRGYSDHSYGQHNYGNKYRNNHRGNHRVNSYHYGSRDRNYRNHNRRYSSGFNFSYGNHYSRHRGYDSGSFVGGLVLGSLFSYPRQSSRTVETVVYRDAPTTRAREIVYVDRPPTGNSAAAVASGRRLLRDLEGNCFERVVDDQGDEIRIQLEAEECNF